MDSVIWGGVALSAVGLCALIWCIIAAIRIRRSGQDDATMRAGLQRLVVVNMGALLLSVLGLMLVVVGIFLS